jgi:radical SAM-linked protein
MGITVSDASTLVLIKFKVQGNTRFLSHAETVKVFQRACVRAGIKAAYSQGFNPRPKLSLPLPRSVGVESDDDLLCLCVELCRPSNSQSGTLVSSFDTEELKNTLARQLPDGCQLLSVTVAKTKASIQPSAATYCFVVQQEYFNEKLKTDVENLLSNESLNIKRRVDAKGTVRQIDVRPFLNSIQLDDKNIIVECKISPAGSIRVDEILKLLELDVGKLAAPIRRVSVQWEQLQN